MSPALSPTHVVDPVAVIAEFSRRRQHRLCGHLRGSRTGVPRPSRSALSARSSSARCPLASPSPFLPATLPCPSRPSCGSRTVDGPPCPLHEATTPRCLPPDRRPAAYGTSQLP